MSWPVQNSGERREWVNGARGEKLFFSMEQHDGVSD